MLAKLQHPHILPVHDFGQSDGFTYIVMPFIKTGTLAAVLTGQPLPFDQIRRVITQVGDALDCAHSQGLVHRDVKPSNILLDERGNCLLADFGIAKILEGADTLTATGSLLGTPKYMSPEQGMGTPIDGRSDIYSLGVVLYEMATGQVPFEAETPLAIVVKHIRDPLPVPSRVNPDIPEPLQRMIFRAMHKERSERFPTASALVDAISTLTVAPPASDATLPIGGVPRLPVAGVTGAGGPDDATVPLAAADGSPTPAPPHHDGVATATGVGHSSPSTVATTERPDIRRPVTLGIAALVVLVLLVFLTQWGDPDTTLTQSEAQTASPISDAGLALAADPTPRSDEAIAAAAEPTTSASSTPPPQPDPNVGSTIPAPDPNRGIIPQTGRDAGGAIPPPDPDGGGTTTGAPAVAAITPAADATTAIDRENALLEALNRAEENSLRRDADAAARDPFPDQGDGTFLDRQTGFRWTVTSFPRQGNDGVLWTDASAYCQDLTLASNVWLAAPRERGTRPGTAAARPRTVSLGDQPMERQPPVWRVEPLVGDQLPAVCPAVVLRST